jgi:tRNA nucleotidyltransferase/poly(A) polymerase
MNLTQIADFQFIKQLQAQGAEVFVVGGIVRDQFLGKESKDIDLIVRLLDIETILTTLKKFGTPVETTVADQFGVIKFMPLGIELDEPIDIALPRVERMMSAEEIQANGITNSYNAFVVNSDPMLKIEDDLKRRDFTMNSIAFDLQKKEFVDPFQGVIDIQNKEIRHTNDEAFTDDPLRMFRAVQFASRFNGFKIADKTFQLIEKNAHRANTVAGERIMVELEKIFEKGNIAVGIKLLRDTCLHGNLFTKRPFPGSDTINTRSDFFFQVCGTSEEFETVLKGDKATSKGIQAIEHILDSFASGKLTKANETEDGLTVFDFDMMEIRFAFFKAIQISESILQSGKVPSVFKIAQTEFNRGEFPKSLKELAVNGNDMKAIGFQGMEIGSELIHCLRMVFSGTKNDKETLLSQLNINSIKI